MFSTIYSYLSRNAFKWAFFSLFITFSGVFLWRCFLVFIQSPNLGAMESNVIYGIQRVLAGMPLYTDPGQLPFAIIQYTPLYYYLCAGLGSIWEVDPDQPMQVYILSRSVSLLLNAGVLIISWLILRRFSLSVRLIWACMFVIFLLLEQAQYSRPDCLEGFCFILGVFAFLQYLDAQRRSMAWLVLALWCGVLAFFAKQNGLLLPCVLIVYVGAFQAKWLKAGAMTLLTAGMLAFVGWVFCGGEWRLFILNVVDGVDNGLSLSYFFGLIYDVAIKKFYLPMFAGLFLMLKWLGGKHVSEKQRFLGLALLGTFFFALITAFKWGSIPNYFADFNTLAVISVGIAAHRWLRQDPIILKQAAFRWAVLLAVLLFIPLHTSQKEWGRVWKDHWNGQFEEAEALRSWVKTENKLPEGRWLFTHDFLLNLFFFRQASFPQNDIVYCCSWPRSTYDYDSFRAEANSGLIQLLIELRHVPLRAFDEVEFTQFREVGEMGSYRIYEWYEPAAE